MITVVIFDIGGVLLDSEKSVHLVYEELGKKFGLPADKCRKYYESYRTRLLNGKISERQFFGMFKKDFSLTASTDDLSELWVEIALKKIKSNKQLLRTVTRLRKVAKVIALSNVTEMRSALDRRLGIYNDFDQTFLSYQLKMIKPNKNIFRYVIKRLKVGPDQMLFIDDQEMNVATARHFGMKAITFKSNTQLFTELHRLDLL